MISLRLTSLLLVGVLGCGASVQDRIVVSATPPPEPPKPTCLVLSVGGPAGIAHLGAIEAVRRSGVEVSCVVGTSMGSMVGALYAYDPNGDTMLHFRNVLGIYVEKTKDEAAGRAVVGGIVGALLLGPFGALAGGAAGAVTVNKLEHKRLVRVLDEYVGGVSIEQLSVPYETAYVAQHGAKVGFYETDSGNLAKAVGASIANPLIFSELDVRGGGPIDPGLDRVAAVPIEQACAGFPDHRMLAINVTGEPSFVSTRMKCPTFEVAVEVPPYAPEKILGDAVTFDSVVEVGRAATAAWLKSDEGRSFIRAAVRRNDFVENSL